MVDGVKRTALVRAPVNSKKPNAIVFCWHGLGGTAEYSAFSWRLDKIDNNSVLVFPQGLPSEWNPKLMGWQAELGTNGDRDVRFFDTMLSDLQKKYTIDSRRVYTMGHSNGAVFCYVLWQARPRVLAAIGPVAAYIPFKDEELPPMDVIHIAGKKDQVIQYELQLDTLRKVRLLNRCEVEGKPWGKPSVLGATIYSANNGKSVVTVIHEGGHEYPTGASEIIVRFFNENHRPTN